MRTADALADVLRDFLGRKDTDGLQGLLHGLWMHWEEAVGEEIASLARPLGRNGDCLEIGVEDSMLMQDMVHYGPALVEMANAYLGRKLFDKARVELLRGRVSLDVQLGGQVGPERYAPGIPREIGGLMENIPPDTAVGRCYRAYVRLVGGLGERDGGPQQQILFPPKEDLGK